MKKPIIAINADFTNSNGDKPSFTYLASGYYDAVSKVGGIPLVIPPMESDEDLEQLLDNVDGVVLVGGADLDPRRDGWMLHPTIRTLAPRRELFDRRLMRIIADRRMPVFGIGAGMQLINVAKGGNLLLHIPEDRPTAMPHHDTDRSGSSPHAGGRTRARSWSGSTATAKSASTACTTWRSTKSAPGFVVTARCPDGIVEAIESCNPDWFAIGTQFHPEADTASALDLRIFEEFVEGVKQSANSMRLVA